MNASPVKRQSSTGDLRPPILIFGASARAAAQSALRAGMRPIAADLFADVDLCEAAEVLPLEKYPDDFLRLARLAPPCPWMYTGGLENHPQIVSEISAGRPLWGNPAEVLRRARDPQEVYAALRRAGLAAAEVRAADRPPAAYGSWLLKPTAGAGGAGIVEWNEAAAGHATLGRPHYFQQRLDGTPLSAVFVATPQAAHLVGVTRQFVGTKTLHAPRFAYCGSLGPLELSPQLTQVIAGAGRAVARAFGLRGLFGLDLIAGDDKAVPTEINPRYVASVEVLELAGNLALIDWHRRACACRGDESVATIRRTGTPARPGECRTDRSARRLESDGQECPSYKTRMAGKAILYARDELTAPSLATLRMELRRDRVTLADIPQPGTTIARGRPICSVLAQGSGATDCLKRLAHAVRHLNRCLSNISTVDYS